MPAVTRTEYIIPALIFQVENLFFAHAIELTVLWCPYTSSETPDLSYPFQCYHATIYGALQVEDNYPNSPGNKQTILAHFV